MTGAQGNMRKMTADSTQLPMLKQGQGWREPI